MPILISKTIGKLRLESTKDEDLTKYPYSIKFKHLNMFEDFGTWHEEERTIFQYGDAKPIEIEGFLFENRILSKTHYVKSKNQTTHYFTINGSSPDGKIFEIKFEIQGKEDVLIYLIYAMFLISIVGADKALADWNYLLRKDIFPIPVEEEIRNIRYFKELASNTCEKYPFLSHFFQQSIQDLITHAKHSISSLEFLK